MWTNSDSGTSSFEITLWSSDAGTDWTQLELTYSEPEPGLLADFLIDYSVSDYVEWFYTPKPVQLQHWTGWRKLHQKVKQETIRDHLRPAKNIYWRFMATLNRWWWRERR